MNKTLDYYKKNYQAYIDSTINSDMSNIYTIFMKYIPKNCSILDLGCGSGRDSLYFHKEGYNVLAVDPVEGFINHVKSLNINAEINDAINIRYINKFDAIWANASLLHVEEKDLYKAFDNCYKALKENGILFVSFKYGEGTAVDEKGRSFIYLNENTFKEYIGNFKIVETFINKDNLANRNLIWLNIILKKE